jgi:adenylylsulfate kinase
VSPTQAIRQQAKNIIGISDFLEVFINTPLEECERRDVKGLYKKARAGEISDFTGISSPFEAPENPDVMLLTEGKSVEQNVDELFQIIIAKVKN